MVLAVPHISNRVNYTFHHSWQKYALYRGQGRMALADKSWASQHYTWNIAWIEDIWFDETDKTKLLQASKGKAQ